MKNRGPLLSLTFEWHSMLRDIIRNFWVIILTAIIVVFGVYIAEHSVYKPVYTSSATLVVRSKAGTSGAYTNLSASSEMANIFAEVFTQNTLKQLAAENIGLEKFDGSISTQVNGDTNLMTVSVTASGPQQAYELLRSVLQVYPDVSEAIFSDAVIDVLLAPQMPTGQSNFISSTRRIQFAGLAAAAMLAVIAVLSLFRDTVKTEESFDKKIDSKLIGSIIHENVHLSLKERLTRKKRALLLTDAFASLRFAEDYQKIVTKLEYMQKNNNSKIFTVTSVAENEGKSTIAANISLSLAARGYKVMLIDMDMKKPSLYKIFDYRNKNAVEFSDVLSRKVSPKEYKFVRYKKGNLFIAMNQKPRKDSSEWIGSKLVSDYLASMKEKVDFIIIDTPPVSVSADAMSMITVSDKALLVVRVDTVATADINDAIMTISDLGGSLAGCILNSVNRPFTLFGQLGTDSANGYNRAGKKHKRYGYSKYDGSAPRSY